MFSGVRSAKYAQFGYWLSRKFALVGRCLREDIPGDFMWPSFDGHREQNRRANRALGTLPTVPGICSFRIISSSFRIIQFVCVVFLRKLTNFFKSEMREN